MEYDFCGEIKFRNNLDEQEKKMCLNALDAALDCPGGSEMSDGGTVSLFGTGYDTDDAMSRLNSLARTFLIAEGEICLSSLDGAFWRYLYQDGEWIKQQGEFNYTGIEADKLLSAIRAYAEWDLEDSESEWVYDRLRDTCGFTDKEIKAIGLGDLIPGA